MNCRTTLARTGALAAMALSFALPCAAETVEEFYKGKTINIYIGYGPGGGYDFFGRLVARHLGRHVPGQPAVVPQNKPGANSYLAANFVYSVAPRDGTSLGIVTQTVALDEAVGTPGVQYKAAEFNWIGRVTSNIAMILNWHTAKAKTIEDVKLYETPISVVGDITPLVLNNVVGTKFKLITGYPGSNEGMLAMEKGEVDSAITSWNTVKTAKQEWLDKKLANMIIQLSPYRHKDLPQVPDMVDLGATLEQKQILSLYASGAVIGRSIFASPGIPADRVTALRQAFDAMIADPVFLADVEQSKAEFDPMPGEELQKIIGEAGAISPAVREKARLARGLD